MKGTLGRLILVGLLAVTLMGGNARAMTLELASESTLRNGSIHIVMTDTVTLTGRTDAVAGSLSRGPGSPWCEVRNVIADPSGTDVTWWAAVPLTHTDGTWDVTVPLSSGLNTITALVFAGDPRPTVRDRGSIEVLYVPPANRITGEQAEDVTLSGAWIVEGKMTLPAGSVLTILPGTVLLLGQGASIVVRGQLLAEGTETQPIRFTHLGDGTTWKQILFVAAADSRFEHCVFEYADSAGEHQDYYEPGPRSYHEAIVALACRVDFNDCTFQKLPHDGPGAEGDALALIADDADHPGETSARITRCRFLGIGQGVHTRYAHVRIEDCYFQGKNGDNDDVDLWGESTPPCAIRNCVFDLPVHEDRINPTRCSAVIEGNLILGSSDHGIVLRDKGAPILINNVILGCPNGGIAVENSCRATLINNTIVNCGRGVRLFDLGRWGPPYRLTPGGGTATLVNCIIWNCSQPITLADSSNTQIADRGSHVTVRYCDIQGGRAGISIAGSRSTVVWGAGNINADPFFVDPAQGDVHLRNRSPAIDSASTEEAPDLDRDGHPRPTGRAADMGAYEYHP